MESKIEITVRHDSPPIPELVELGKSYYDSGEIISEEYLNWQYNKNPFGHPFYSLAKDGDKIIGQYLVIPMNYVYDSREIKGTLSLNTLTHPEYQGRGLFTKMATKTYDFCKENGIEYTVGFPNPLSFGGFIKKLEFKAIGYCDLKVSVLRPISFILDKFKKDKTKHGGSIHINLDKINESTNISILTKTDGELYDAFWNKIIKSSNYYRVNKTWKFINWRYFEIPVRKYYHLKTIKDDEITCVCIFKVEKVLGMNTAVIMDFLVDKGNTGEARKLLHKLKKELRRNKINLMAIINTNIPYIDKILSKEYFFNVPKKMLPQQIPYILRVHNQDETQGKKEDFNHWSMSFGNYDIF